MKKREDFRDALIRSFSIGKLEGTDQKQAMTFLTLVSNPSLLAGGFFITSTTSKATASYSGNHLTFPDWPSVGNRAKHREADSHGSSLYGSEPVTTESVDWPHGLVAKEFVGQSMCTFGLIIWSAQFNLIS